MRSICLFLFLNLVLSAMSYSQDRVNLKPDKFDAKSTQITEATFWYYDEPNWEGQSNHRDGRRLNFNYIRFAQIKTDTSSYYILIKNFNNGAYKYPSIYRGWYDFKSIRFYIYPKHAYEQIKNIKQGETLVLPHIGSVLWYGYGEEYNEHKYIQEIKRYISAYENKEKIFIYEGLLYIKRTKSEGKDVIRFWFPDDSFSEELFEKMYWELSYNYFKNIFIKE